MKKVLLVMCLLLGSNLLHAQIEAVDCIFTMTEPKCDSLQFEDDIVKISFSPHRRGYFMYVDVVNKSNSIIGIDWDKFILVDGGKSYKIIFKETTQLLQYQSKGISYIAPHTKAGDYVTTINSMPSDGYIPTLFSGDDIKKYPQFYPNKQQIQQYIVPIVLNNGEYKYYSFTIEIKLK